MAFTVVTRFKADTTDYTAGTRRAAQETRGFGAEVQRTSRTVQQSAAANVAAAAQRREATMAQLAQYRLIAAGAAQGSAQQVAATRLAESATKRLGVTTAASTRVAAKSFDSLRNSTQTFASGFRGGGGIGGVLSYGPAALAALGGAAIKTAADFEQTEIAFGGLLGSGERATAFLDQMQAFAAKTPFEFPQLAKAAQQLMATGTAAEDVIPVMTTLGNVTSALGVSGEGIDRVVRALGQMQGRGKVVSQELIQISEAIPGFSAIGAIAESMGITTAEAFKRVESGAVSADEGMAAILDGMQRFPGAAGAMERQSKTLNGQLSTMKDNLRLLAIDGLEPLLPFIKGHIQYLSQMVKVLGVGAKAVTDFLGTIGNAVRDVGGFIGDLPGHGGVVDFVSGLFGGDDANADAKKIGAATGNLATGIKGLGQAAQEAAVDSEKLGEALLDLPKAERTAASAHRSLADAQAELNELLAKGPVDLEKVEQAEEQLASTSRSLEMAQRRLGDAQEDLNELLADGPVDADAVADAYERVESSSESLADAQDRLADAQRELNDVMAGSTAEELARGQLSLEQATLGVAQAKQSEADAQDRLVEAYKSGDAGDIANANLGLKNAKLGVRSANFSLADAEKELNTLQNAGKAGSEDLAEAQDNLADAERGVRDATKAHTEALKDLHAAQAGDPEFARKVADAELAVADARYGVEQASKARYDAERALREASADDPQFLRNVRDLEDQVTEATYGVVDAEVALALVRQTIANPAERTTQDTMNATIAVLRSLGGEYEHIANELETQHKFRLSVDEAMQAIGLVGSSLVGIAKGLRDGNFDAGQNEVRDSAGNVIGRFARGGIARGWSLVGEEGPELLHVGSPSRVLSHQDTMAAYNKMYDSPVRYHGGGGGLTTTTTSRTENVSNINVYGAAVPEIARAVAREQQWLNATRR